MSKTTMMLVAAGGLAALYFLSKKGGASAGGGGAGSGSMQTCAQACSGKGGRMLKINTKPPHYRCMIGTKMQFSCLGLASKYPGK